MSPTNGGSGRRGGDGAGGGDDRGADGGDGAVDRDGTDCDGHRGPDTDGVDPVTLEVVRNACVAVAEEMNANLVRTGYSPNIKERRDCSCALFDGHAEMVAQAENVPVHLGAMPFSVAAAIERFPPETLEPGDSVLLNDPFRGGAHLPDLTLVSPVFHGGEVIAYAANRAHHADVGGAHAGSIAADSTEIYQEGLRIPPVKLEAGGDLDEGILEVLLANVRTPEERRGDLRAQIGANEMGRRRVNELLAAHGEAFEPALAAIKDYSERRIRAEIDALPDGTYEFADVLDGDGAGNEDLPIRAAVTIDGDEVVVAFAGTADQTDGPVNAVFAVTASAVYYAVRCVTDPDVPPNQGCYRPITVEAPAGSLVNPDPPAAVVGGNLETSQRITDVVLGAFSQAVPDRVVAGSQGTMNNVTFGGVDPRDASASAASGDSADASGGGRPYAFYETQGGGAGARAGADGMDGVHVHMTNTLNTPVEVLETAYPLRVTRYELRADSAGAGEYRGGLGLRRDVRVREHVATFSLLADRHRNAPYGLGGGEAGDTGAAYLRPPGEGVTDAERLPEKTTREVPPGATVSVRTPGGGGYGDPADRDPAAVRRDVRLGKCSLEAAHRAYPHAIDRAALGGSGTASVHAADTDAANGAASGEGHDEGEGHRG